MSNALALDLRLPFWSHSNPYLHSTPDALATRKLQYPIPPVEGIKNQTIGGSWSRIVSCGTPKSLVKVYSKPMEEFGHDENVTNLELTSEGAPPLKDRLLKMCYHRIRLVRMQLNMPSNE